MQNNHSNLYIESTTVLSDYYGRYILCVTIIILLIVNLRLYWSTRNQKIRTVSSVRRFSPPRLPTRAAGLIART